MKLVHVEKITAMKIRDVDGKLAGRLEEVHADWRGGECIVTYFVIAPGGTYALQEIGFRKRTRSLIVPWDRMDFSDSEKPRLNCRVDELTAITTG